MTLKDWNQKKVSSKIFTIIGLILSVAIIILALLQIFDVWDKAVNVCEPLLGILILLQAIENWKTNKLVALASLFASIAVFALTALTILILSR
jgi:SNF family Na+-dependent transporter